MSNEEDIVDDVVHYILVPPIWEFTGDIFLRSHYHKKLLLSTAGHLTLRIPWFLCVILHTSLLRLLGGLEIKFSPVQQPYSTSWHRSAYAILTSNFALILLYFMYLCRVPQRIHFKSKSLLNTQLGAGVTFANAHLCKGHQFGLRGT